jgi:hypothetical protein
LQRAADDQQLSLNEKQVLAGVTNPDHLAKLIALIWTFKEGFVKATGEGIGFGLERISLDIEPQSLSVASVKVDGEDIKQDNWNWRSGWISGDEGKEYGWVAYWQGPATQAAEIQHISWRDFIMPFMDTS